MPKGTKLVSYKWIFIIKYKANGSLERYKARLVAIEFTQTDGINYQETFAPVAKINSIKILTSLATNLNWTLQQFDFNKAFLHGDYKKEVYMEVHPSCIDKLEEKICWIKKSLYGLKKPLRAWFGKFTKVIVKFGYRQTQGDHTLFIKQRSPSKLFALIVYVDDIIVISTDQEEIDKLQVATIFSSEFEIKDLERLKYFIGREVAYSKRGIFYLNKNTPLIIEGNGYARMQTNGQSHWT